MNEELHLRIKQVIVDALMLEDVAPEDIDTDAPLFVEGLGLDSIDALELAVALHKEFGVKTRADDERNREIFFSVASLAKFIEAEQAKAEGAGPDPSNDPPPAAPGAQNPAGQDSSSQGAD